MMDIRVDGLLGSEIAAFLEEHIAEMRSVSPPKSKHALDLAGLRTPEMTFWTVWDDQQLVGCGALRQLEPDHGEIKSMRTGRRYRGRGVAAAMLQHIVAEARRRGYRRLSLETGAMPFFEPARRLYARHGFVQCAPFGSYQPDPNSVFMTLEL